MPAIYVWIFAIDAVVVGRPDARLFLMAVLVTLWAARLTLQLFRYSRHPNFFFEQAQWWAFYGLGAAAAVSAGAGLWGGALNGSIAGAALLTVLFIGSTIFTESISASKYPANRDYQRTTSMLVPWPPRRRAPRH